ncbi:MAG: YpdA family putative bacillithiol disulfide reductase [Bacteroidia bacterium]|nr:YpdA family putative bacillithiol disulfide reductase [Bacteroidia bacterium]
MPATPPFSAPLDVLIIGGGPIGLACGIEAVKQGLSVLIVEKGCLVNSIYRYPANMTFFSTSERIEIGGAPFVSHGPRPTRREALEYYRRVKTLWNLPVHTYEEVTDVLDAPDGFRVQTSKGEYLARFVVVATGFFGQPNPLGVPGEDLPKVRHYYDEPYPYADQRVIVVGAANSAVDVALEVWRKGAEVTLVVRGESINPRVKYWIRPDIENRIQEGSIKAWFNSQIMAIRPEEVDLITPEGLLTLPNDFVLAMTGYRPDFGFLARIGLLLAEGPGCLPWRDERSFESNRPGVFLAGTVCGGMLTSKWFIENSIGHAATVMAEIAARRA